MPQPTTAPGPANFDDLVIGTGMAGLTVAAMLARSGRRVLMLEAHDQPGGYAHTFAMGKYRFCAQVHYIFNCAPGEPIHNLLRDLGLDQTVTFRRLDPDGFDHIVIAGDRYRVPSGFARFEERLLARFPGAARPLRRYFATLCAMRDEIATLPERAGWRELLLAPFRFPNLLRFRTWTLQRFYDHVKMPPRLQAVLAGQAGDYLLPPEQVSFPLHVALVASYDRGAYYPDKHFSHFVEAITDYIRGQPGCRVLLEHEVERILAEDGRVVGVRTVAGETFHAERYISNADPARTLQLLGPQPVPAAYERAMKYEYSSSNFTIYLGVKGIDLREHGFGSFNVWHYPHDDINRIYRVQSRDNDLSDPWLFMSTPTLHTDEPGLCPPGHQILEVATSCSYDHFKALRDRDPRAYTREKVRIRDNILSIIEAQYVPGLREHLAMRVAGTPLTNERFVRSPRGNAYGAALTPDHVRWPRIGFETPLSNLFVVNATAGYPSVGGAVGSGLRLFERLSGGAS
jgi:all-trans-retinol 13,14-reductase